MIVGVCGALNSLPYIAHDLARGELRAQDEPRYYALFLAFMATMAAVPVVNNLGVMWVAIEATTVVSVLLVSIYRTGRSLEAAWKYLVLGSVGIALALFGTMMTYYAASAVDRRVGKRAQLDRAPRGIGAARSRRDAPRLHLRAGRLRHEGGPGADAHVAARRAQPGAVADLGAACPACSSTARSTPSCASGC